MRVLVTGGQGFIGSHLVGRLLADGHRVWVLDDGSTGRRRRLGAAYIDGTIRGQVALAEVFRVRPAIVFHLAALSTVGACEEDPQRAISVNVGGTFSVSAAAAAEGVRLIFASTAAVYGAGRISYSTEEDEPTPNTVYGITKIAGEQFAALLCPNSVVLRLANVYGPGQTPIGENLLVPRAIAYIFGQASDFGIRGDGEQERDLVYVDDVVDAMIRAMDPGVPPDTYNVGTGTGWSVNQICNMIALTTEYLGEFPMAPARLYEPRRLVLDVTRAHEVLGWQAKTDLLPGLRQVVKAWQKPT